MLRQWHALPGLIFALLLAVTAGTGAILAFDAFRDARSAPVVAEETIVLSELSDRIAVRFPSVESITRTPSGRVRVTFLSDGRPKSAIVDPITTLPTEALTVSPVLRTITNLHRAWLAGDGGRMVAGLSALAMLLLCGTGLVLLKRQTGGWRGLVLPFNGSGMRRWHGELGRFALVGLMLSSLTGTQMSLVGFDLIPDGSRTEDIFVSASGGPRLPPAALAGLASLSLAELREITFPDPSDATDPIRVKTDTMVRFVDPATGEILREDRHSIAWHVRDLAYRLHTAEGMSWLALLLGLSASGGVVLALTGLTIGLRKRLRSGVFQDNVASSKADILLLVGSEGGTTYRFAQMLGKALSAAGRKVHLAAMNEIPPTSSAQQIILLAATAGSGEAPASAIGFIGKLALWRGQKPEVIVLGFGDQTFPNFCAYADQLEASLAAHGFPVALAGERIDRQSHEAFAEWSGRLSEHLQLPLRLNPQAETAKQHLFELVERANYGLEVQAATSILCFRILPQYRGIPITLQRILGLLPRFEPGDLLAIAPPGDSRQRYYSIASSSTHGILEICVRNQPGGLCSGYLCNLQDHARISASIRPNPGFRPDNGKGPLILIGAGAGIAPLMGFLRQKGSERPVHLYWGGRSPSSDFLYGDELKRRVQEGTLTSLQTIFSRSDHGGYVQDLLSRDAPALQAMIEAGGQILICGSRDMAEGVHQALDPALSPLRVDVSLMRQNGRLLEDVY